MTVSEARDTLRALAAAPMNSQRVTRVSTLPSSRPGQSLGPERSGCTTTTSPGTLSTSAASVGVQVLQSEFQKQDSSGSVSISSMPLEALRIASNSVADSTKAKYISMFFRFQKFGRAKGINVLTYSFSQILFIGFLIAIR